MPAVGETERRFSPSRMGPSSTRRCKLSPAGRLVSTTNHPHRSCRPAETLATSNGGIAGVAERAGAERRSSFTLEPATCSWALRSPSAAAAPADIDEAHRYIRQGLLGLKRKPPAECREGSQQMGDAVLRDSRAPAWAGRPSPGVGRWSGHRNFRSFRAGPPEPT